MENTTGRPAGLGFEGRTARRESAIQWVILRGGEQMGEKIHLENAVGNLQQEPHTKGERECIKKQS